MNAHGVPLLCDFGLAIISEELGGLPISTVLQGSGNCRWMPHEMLFGTDPPTKGCDVWAFGMVVIEVSLHHLHLRIVLRDCIVVDFLEYRFSRTAFRIKSSWTMRKLYWLSMPANFLVNLTHSVIWCRIAFGKLLRGVGQATRMIGLRLRIYWRSYVQLHPPPFWSLRSDKQ